MYSTFKDVEKLLVRPPKVKDPRPDNFVFRLHYQYTFTVLIVSSILVTSYSYIDKKGGWQPESYLVPSCPSHHRDMFIICQDPRYNAWRTSPRFRGTS